MTKDKAQPELVDAVGIGLTMQLPPDVLSKYAVGKWAEAKYGGETTDASGQRWVTLSMPIGPSTRSHRSDTIHAVALVRQGEAYSVARLELPLSVAGQYVVETTDPEARGSALDQAHRRVDEMSERV